MKTMQLVGSPRGERRRLKRKRAGRPRTSAGSRVFRYPRLIIEAASREKSRETRSVIAIRHFLVCSARSAARTRAVDQTDCANTSRVLGRGQGALFGEITNRLCHELTNHRRNASPRSRAARKRKAPRVNSAKGSVVTSARPDIALLSRAAAAA